MNDFDRVLLIVANAGSGKTYRLVTRCLELLARGQSPEKILALTFTRKAAAEFLQKFFERLTAAVQHPARLQELRTELGDPALTAEQCLVWLRHLTAALPRLAMGTMDGFFGRILRSFPFELGLGREFRLLDNTALEEHRQKVLDRFFASATTDQNGLDQLVELLRQQSRLHSGQKVHSVIEQAVTSLQQSYLETAPGITWGDPQTIWPQGSPLLEAPDVEDAIAALRLEMQATHPDLGPTAWAQWDTWFDLAAAHRPPRRMDEKLFYFLSEKLTGGSVDKKSGGLYVPVGGKAVDRLYLRGNLPELREALRLALIKLEIEANLATSRALHALLARYEELYDNAVRESGALTFSDITRFLAEGVDEPWRRDLDYRLDARYDHWLLDEFQDTSRTQWQILQTLADEIIQDSSLTRSFFYVGDTKQAIYGWRGGDARLFWEIRDRYNHGAKKVVEEKPLSVSRRSARAIVQVVDQVFAPDVLQNHAGAFRLPQPSVDAWRRAWVDHQPHENAGEGYATFRVVEAAEDADQDAAVPAEVLSILREVDPLARGLDCAILVRSNSELARYVALLKESGLPVAAEGKTNPCLASPSGRALFDLIRAIAIPADEIARAHALASPWQRVIDGDFTSFAAEARAAAAEQGFASVLRSWIARADALGLTPREELEPFAALAADYDTARPVAGDWLALVRLIEHHQAEENETPGAIRIMTIHQAKGLGVDMVILPELHGKAMSTFRDEGGILLQRDAAGVVQWGLSLPRKDFCEADPVLHQAREDMRARQTYEALCVLYVAMTRAKKALYCVAPAGRNEKNAGKWLENTFPSDDLSRRDVGDPQWFQSFEPVTSSSASPQILTSLPPSVDAITAAAPSRQAPTPIRSILHAGAARQLGTEVHTLLARLAWLGDKLDTTGISEAVVTRVQEFLQSEQAQILQKLSAPTLLWRERAFEVEINGQFVGGIFDRVHISLDKDQNPTSAVILDFKTGPGNYVSQLAAYQFAAAKLLGLSEDSIKAQVIIV